MLVVETIGRIRRAHFSQGKSIKEIARELGISRNTVRKILRSEETSSTYEREIQPRPKLGRWKADIDRMLAKNADAPARERLTLIRLFEELRAHGYEGGYDAVRRYAKTWAREHTSQTASAYVPLSFAPGEAYQFDSHGEFKVKRFVLVWRRPVVDAVLRQLGHRPFARGLGLRVSICRHLLLAAKRASARRGSRMRSTGEAGASAVSVLDVRFVVSPIVSPSANGGCSASA